MWGPLLTITRPKHPAERSLSRPWSRAIASCGSKWTMANFDGPLPGRRYDARIVAHSGLVESLILKRAALEKIFTLYGSLAYPVKRYLDAPFRKLARNLTEGWIGYKVTTCIMILCRVCVVWASGQQQQSSSLGSWIHRRICAVSFRVLANSALWQLFQWTVARAFMAAKLEICFTLIFLS